MSNLPEIRVVENQVSEYIDWLKSLPDMVRETLEENPKQAVHLLKKIEILETSAKKVKMVEVVKNAAVTKMQIVRQIGGYIIKQVKDSGRTEKNFLGSIGLDKLEAARYRKVASIPDWAWKHTLDVSPTINGAIKEHERYLELKTLIDGAKVKEKEKLLKDYVLQGYKPMAVEAKLREQAKVKSTKSSIKEANERVEAERDDDTEWTKEFSEHDNPETEEEDTVTRLLTMDEDNFKTFVLNANELIKWADNFKSYCASIDTFTKKHYNGIMKTVSLVKARLHELSGYLEERAEDVK